MTDLDKGATKGSHKVLKFGGLGLAAVVALGVYISYRTSEVDQMPVGRPAAGGLSAVGHEECGHDHEARDLPQIKVVDEVVISRDGAMLDAEVGELLDVSFGSDLTVSGKVIMNEQVLGDRRAVSLSLVGQKGYLYWLETPQGGVTGNVVISRKQGNLAYQFEHKAGSWSLQELPFQSYICASGDQDESVGMPADQAEGELVGEPAEVVPGLNSRPGAEAVVYLDFDGEVVTGTRWNAAINQAVINAEPSPHSEAEIAEIWEEVSEDMRPFELNVTTNRDVFDQTPVNRRMHVIITPTKDARPTAGGVAFFDSFFDGSIDPCWVFNLLDGSAAMTCSHEVGHTFGLLHDGNTDQGDPDNAEDHEYHEGNGVWGPIMGAPFGHTVVNWSQGDYEFSTNREDDLATIADLTTNGFGYRNDDHGDSRDAGSYIDNDFGDYTVDVTGVVETTNDVDVFTFKTSGGVIDLTVAPTAAMLNMNVLLTLYDNAGNVIVQSEEPGYSASILEGLEPGHYYFHVEGIADGEPEVLGFNDYGSLGEYNISGVVGGLGGVIVTIVNPQVDKVSLAEGNGLIMEGASGDAPDSVLWSQVSGPAGGAAFSSESEMATKVTFSQPGLYTLKLSAFKDVLESEALVQVSVESLGSEQIFENKGPAITMLTPEEFYVQSGTLNARVVDDGVPVDKPAAVKWTVDSGRARLTGSRTLSPRVTFRDRLVSGITLEASDGEVTTFRQLEVVSIYELKPIIDLTSSGHWFVPTSDVLGLTWVEPDFDDSSWSIAAMGIGYNKNNDYVPFIGVGGDLNAVMRGKSSSAFLRTSFVLPTTGYISDLTLKMKYNDGFVTYLNGVEVLRRNVPAEALTWNSTAYRSRSFADVVVPDTIDLYGELAAANLTLGENVLAFHGVNRSVSDNQFLLDPVLLAGVVASPYFKFNEKYGLEINPNGDRDNDGILNVVEHARGTDPTVANSLDHLVPQDDGSMELTLPLEVPQDMDYHIERSVDMETWENVSSKHGMAAWTGDVLRVTVSSQDDQHITYSFKAVSGEAQVFYRVVYSLRSPLSGVTH